MEKQLNILIADDDPEIREVVRLLLSGEGYTIVEAKNGVEAIDLINENIDLVILDIMMPEMSGLLACEQIRKLSDAPILFLTAKSLDSDITMGFSVGADDYLSKPFSYSELISRVKAMLRRYYVYGAKIHNPKDNVIHIGEIDILSNEARAVIGANEAPLTDIEYRILLLLGQNRGRIYSIQNIYERIWNEPYFYSSNNTVMVHIRNLRKKLSDCGVSVDIIKTVWGKGYRIE